MIADLRILFGLVGLERSVLVLVYGFYQKKIRLPIMLKFKVWKQSEK